MSPTLYIFGIVSALLVLVVVIEALRRQRLRERHALWWLIGGILALIVSVFPGVLTWTAELIGVAIPTNLVFFVSIGLLFIVCVQQSVELTDLEKKTRTLAESVALHDLRLRELEAERTSDH